MRQVWMFVFAALLLVGFVAVVVGAAGLGLALLVAPLLAVAFAPSPPARCRSCGAAIHWSTTRAGKAIPLDMPLVGCLPDEAPPEGEAPVVLLDRRGEVARGRRVELRALKRGGSSPPGLVVGREAHFATCDDPDRWRKRGEV